ncbi:prepilin-type N-terminal cleavage/methylation domain-containing protein [Fundidesulfovibrio terrae]|uniref:prepilin-type N-terminal cleavage/methylation domain-containing protein n=1 Tax=Fundidesulfovibrio terrae TaxID=2922866 RepID=UPI001FAED29F|nr:prepilin-type N-terminal cleavage/methylation domain-containing protein [Fundidesulfovibrio terrae]
MTPRKDSRNFDGQKGVTLKELTIVLILIGVLAAVALPRFSNLNADAISDAETLKSTLRYVRTRALSDIYTWQLQVAGSTLTVQRNTATPTSYTIAFTTAGVAAGTTTFDNRGQPTGTLSYAVTGYPSSPVTITTGTGFVP